jgi:DNA-binding CsgD family transcriptional regulator
MNRVRPLTLCGGDKRVASSEGTSSKGRRRAGIWPDTQQALLELSHDIRHSVGTILELVDGGRRLADARSDSARFLDGIEFEADSIAALCRAVLGDAAEEGSTRVDQLTKRVVAAATSSFDATIDLTLEPAVVTGNERTPKAVPAVSTAPAARHEVPRFLTPRERETLERLVHGETGTQLAANMGINYATARTHVQNVLTKLGVHSRVEAVAFAISNSLISTEETAPEDEAAD